MNFFSAIAKHTPPAMLLVVALVVWRGYRFTRARVRPIRTYLLLPVIFIVWGVLHIVLAARLLGVPLTAPIPIIGFIVALLIGAPLGWFSINENGFAIDHQRKLAFLPGSWVPILRYLAVFVVNYVVSMATQLHLLPFTTLALLSFAVSGLMIGYFGVWMGRFLNLYQRAPQTNLSQTNPPPSCAKAPRAEYRSTPKKALD
jgi:ABC-type amino acid transport system permease subunit